MHDSSRGRRIVSMDVGVNLREIMPSVFGYDESGSWIQ